MRSHTSSAIGIDDATMRNIHKYILIEFNIHFHLLMIKTFKYVQLMFEEKKSL